MVLGKSDDKRKQLADAQARLRGLTKLARKVGAGVAAKGDQYESHRASMAAKSRARAAAGREVGPLPAVANPARRESCRESFRLFCETYFPETFVLAWSPDHLKAIARIEEACIRGGLFAFAMPRGSGKTSLNEAACIWAVLYGYRHFVALIGPTAEHAEALLDSIKIAIETDDRLYEDFPEAAYLVRSFDGIVARANGQTLDGERTRAEWGSKFVVFPTVPGAKSSGAVIRTAGLTGQIRGMVSRSATGQKRRPDLVIADDPQTDESARSPSQCAERESLLAGAVLGLAGPGKKISGFVPCTVIRPDDMADRILNRDKNPAWQGERWKLIYEWPKRQDLWDKYADLRRASLKNGGRGETATEFYAENRADMDDGAVVGWSERHNPEQLSALQHAWDLRIDHGDRAFFSEYQNSPLPDVEANENELKAEEVAKKTNGLARGELPIDSSAVTMFVDVQQTVLYWLVAAWAPDFTGAILDYGTWPDQKTDYFRLSGIKRTIAKALPKAGIEGGIFGALQACCREQFGREFKSKNGSTLRVSKCLVDANWNQSTEVVYQFARLPDFAGVVMPSHGKYHGATGAAFSDHKPLPGERMGHRWRIPPGTGRRAVRYVLIDANYWKTFIADRIRVPLGDRASLTAWGNSRVRHQMLADHICAERPESVTSKLRTVDEWKIRQPGIDNHFLDCLAGAAVAASIVGVSLGESVTPRPAVRKRVRLSERQAAMRARR